MRGHTPARSMLIRVSTLVMLTGLAACGQGGDVCPAVGYTYDGPAELELAGSLPSDAIVSACFGTDCTPQPVPRAESRGWSVEQKPPWIGQTHIPGNTALRVVVRSGTLTLHDEVHEIPVSGETTRGCPGPFEYESVDVAL